MRPVLNTVRQANLFPPSHIRDLGGDEASLESSSLTPDIICRLYPAKCVIDVRMSYMDDRLFHGHWDDISQTRFSRAEYESYS